MRSAIFQGQGTTHWCMHSWQLIHTSRCITISSTEFLSSDYILQALLSMYPWGDAKILHAKLGCSSFGGESVHFLGIQLLLSRYFEEVVRWLLLFLVPPARAQKPEHEGYRTDQSIPVIEIHHGEARIDGGSMEEHIFPCSLHFRNSSERLHSIMAPLPEICPEVDICIKSRNP